MIYKRVRTRVDYYHTKTNRMQVKMLVHYHILDADGNTMQVIPAKEWQGYRRKQRSKQ